MKDFKSTAQQYVQMDGQKSGCSFGCMGIGCAGIFMLVLLVCGGGWYGLLYSSLPLKAIEALIEQDDQVEIEGLSGNLASGFTADEVRFKADGDNWSNLTNLKFKYSNNSRMFGSDRIIIEELSVDGGTIYADWDPDENELDIDPDFEEEFEEIGEEFEEIEEEFNAGLSGIKEIRVDLIHVANIKIVNPTTGLEITLDKISFDGFQWLDGKLVSLGELFVRSSQMELDTVPSILFAAEQNSQRFEGVIQSEMDHRLKEDVSFAIDFAIVDSKFLMEGIIFDGAVEISKSGEGNAINYVDFSPVDFVKLDVNAILPSRLNFRVDYGKSFKNDPVGVSKDGTFQLGATQFTNLRFVEKSKHSHVAIAGTGVVDGTEVTASTYFDDDAPFWVTKLTAENSESNQDLWAQTVYDKRFDELPQDRQLAIEAMLIEKSRAEPSSDEPSEDSVDESETAPEEEGTNEDSEVSEPPPFPIDDDDGADL